MNDPLLYSPTALRPAQVNTQSLGRLKISITTAAGFTPVAGARIRISYMGNPDQVIEELTTNDSGQTDTIELPTPNRDYSLEPEANQPYSQYTLTVSAPGYEDLVVAGTQLLSGQTAIQDIKMAPSRNNPPAGILSSRPTHSMGNIPQRSRRMRSSRLMKAARSF